MFELRASSFILCILHLDAIGYTVSASELELDNNKQARPNHDCSNRQYVSWLVLECQRRSLVLRGQIRSSQGHW